MSLSAPHIGLQQGDTASGLVGETFYLAYSWLNIRTNTIVVSIYVHQEHGQDVLVRTDTLMTATRDDGVLDCPKLIMVGNTLIVHWVSGLDHTRQLHRATFDLEAINGSWVDHGSISTHGTALYDVATAGDATDFVLVDRTLGDGDGWAAYRFTSPYGWLDYVWIETYEPGMADRVLACYAHAADGDVLVSYQAEHRNPDGGIEVQHQLWTARHNWTDGAVTDDVQSFTLFEDCEFAAVGHDRLALSRRVALVAEMRGVNDGSLASGALTRGLVYRQLDSSDASRVLNEHGTPSLHMVSRPFVHASGTPGQPNVYVMTSWKQMLPASPWDQSYGFLVNLDFRNWWRPSGTNVRARPVCSVTDGTFDGRPTGGSPVLSAQLTPGNGKRMNHLSHASVPPPFGPYTRTRVVACTLFARAIPQSNGVTAALRPVGASIAGIRVHLEEPWIVPRDPKSASLPVDRNVHVAYALGCYENQQVGDGLVISGGTPSVYDGRDVVELGFVHAPEILDANFSLAATGVYTTGQYLFVAVYEWEDAQGQVHRSRPSRPFIADCPADDQFVSLSVRTISLSMKENRVHCPDASNISIVIYRMRRTEPVLFRCFAYNATWGGSDAGYDQTPQNDPNTWRITIRDNTSEDQLRFNEPFPWTLAGVNPSQGASGLPQVPVEASGPMARWQNRLWMASSIRPNKVLYSKEIVEAEGSSRYGIPEFTAAHIFAVDGISGITAMHAMDASLIIWTRDGVYRLVGEGADDGGFGSSLTLEVVAEGTGCIEPRSVVLAPPGLFFQSAKGYYLLNRNLELDYITSGAAVEDYIRDAGNVRAATLLEDRHQIRLTCDAPPVPGDPFPTPQPRVLVYDYFHRQWSRIRLPRLAEGRFSSTAGGCEWRGIEGGAQHVVVQQSALLVERGLRDPSRFADDALSQNETIIEIPIPADVETGWIHVAGISGYKRVRSIGIQLRKPNASPVSVRLTYDYDGSYGDSITETFTAPENTASGYIRIRPSHQKISAIRIRIFEDLAVPATENLAITSIVLECGLKKGPRRVSNSQIGV